VHLLLFVSIATATPLHPGATWVAPGPAPSDPLTVSARAARLDTSLRRGRRHQRLLAESACYGGDAEGCVELAFLDADKRPTSAWDLAIDAHDAGARSASLVLARIDGPRAVPWLRASCEAGEPRACGVLALQRPEEAGALADHACALGARAACVDAWLTPDARPIAERIASLTALCDAGSEAACREADWLSTGSAPQPLKIVDHAAHATMAAETLVPWLRGCMAPAIADDPLWRGRRDVQLWVDADGQLGGLRVDPSTGEPTGPFASCLADATRGLTITPTAAAAGQLHTGWTLDHRATVQTQPRAGVADTAPARWVTRWAREAWEVEAETCYLSNGGDVDDDAIALVDLLLARDGRLKRFALRESSGASAIDDCLLGLVASHAPPLPDTPWEARAPLTVRFDFLQTFVRW
jgi:hypothetical protein